MARVVTQPLERATNWIEEKRFGPPWPPPAPSPVPNISEPAAAPAAQVAASQPPTTPQVRHVPEASPAPRPSAEEVARDPDIPKRIAQIQDPVQRAEAQTLLKEIKAEATARENSNQRAQVVELER